jgi:hypothetical protein
LKSNSSLLTKKIADTILKQYNIKDHETLLYLTDNGKSIGGSIFEQKYLKHFSIKFSSMLENINNNVYQKSGSGIIFVYSNLVKVGVDLFCEVLNRNGYLEFQENPASYTIKPDTKCYFCGYNFSNHSDHQDVPKHDFHPAAFISFTGKSDENIDSLPEEKERILKKYFNTAENKNGKTIKIILGSNVMSEGITLDNVKEIHIMDVHYNLGRVDQVMGRGIRFCRHYRTMTEDNPFPKVNVYKYVVSLETGLSSEEKLYGKAEHKYLLVKESERILQEEAIDCPLNRNNNVFPEELEKYAGCGSKDKPCPASCGYMECDFKCGDKLLNAKYYDPDRNIYKKVELENLDYSTYNNFLAGDEIQNIKDKIKELFKINHIYTLDDVLKYVRDSYPPEKLEMFDEYYVFQALDNLIPMNANDFNNFSDVVTDKFNRSGYLIYRNKYYIFQPFNENETLPTYYRAHNITKINNKLTLNDYIKHDIQDNPDLKEVLRKKDYDFDSVQEYYDSRAEYDYVGIIDKSTVNDEDEFKIRKRRPKILNKRRETGIPSFKGAVCNISKDTSFLNNITVKLNVKDKKKNRKETCQTILKRLHDLEKYSISQNKITYLIIPANHKTLPFPLNLEDRITSIVNKIKNETKQIVTFKVSSKKELGTFSDINYLSYTITFDSSVNKYEDIMKKYDGVKTNDVWTINVS